MGAELWLTEWRGDRTRAVAMLGWSLGRQMVPDMTRRAHRKEHQAFHMQAWRLHSPGTVPQWPGGVGRVGGKCLLCGPILLARPGLVKWVCNLLTQEAEEES